jgi:hypothetical protein
MLQENAMHHAGDTESTRATLAPPQPSRRGLLTSGAVALLAGAAVTVASHEASGDGSDAELIAACDELVRIDAAWRAFVGWRGHSIEREQQTQAEFERATAVWRTAVDRVYDAGEITTHAGALALARAAVAIAPLRLDGSFLIDTHAGIFGFDVLEFLTGSTPGDRIGRDA